MVRHSHDSIGVGVVRHSRDSFGVGVVRHSHDSIGGVTCLKWALIQVYIDICMLLSTGGSLDNYGTIPEEVLGRIAVAVSVQLAWLLPRLQLSRPFLCYFVLQATSNVSVWYEHFKTAACFPSQVVRGLSYLWSLKIMHRGMGYNH